jgi:hypothetical protein
MQPIGIRPTNDFAFKKTFGSPENKLALISLLNAILTLPVPIVDVTIENPYNLQDFQNDKLCKRTAAYSVFWGRGACKLG